MPTPPRGPSLAWPLLSPWEPPWHLSVYLVLISLVFVWVVYQPFPKCFVYLLSPVAHILALSIFSINMNCLVYLFFLKKERERERLTPGLPRRRCFGWIFSFLVFTKNCLQNRKQSKSAKAQKERMRKEEERRWGDFAFSLGKDCQKMVGGRGKGGTRACNLH